MNWAKISGLIRSLVLCVGKFGCSNNFELKLGQSTSIKSIQLSATSENPSKCCLRRRNLVKYSRPFISICMECRVWKNVLSNTKEFCFLKVHLPELPDEFHPFLTETSLYFSSVYLNPFLIKKSEYCSAVKSSFFRSNNLFSTTTDNLFHVVGGRTLLFPVILQK
jgi:hypothetical protein